jgi:hypothetical protein
VIIVQANPEGAIFRKVGLIWGIPVNLIQIILVGGENMSFQLTPNQEKFI